MFEKRRKVYVPIVADLFHYGHVEFLKRAREFGDYLVAGLLTDDMAASYKRRPVLTLAERMSVLEACRYVDEVRVHDQKLTNEWLQENSFVARVFATGNDSDRSHRLTRKDYFLPEYYVEVPYEEGISTTEIIRRIRAREND